MLCGNFMILQNGWFFYWNQPFLYKYFCRLYLSAQPAFLGTFFTAPLLYIEAVAAVFSPQQ